MTNGNVGGVFPLSFPSRTDVLSTVTAVRKLIYLSGGRDRCSSPWKSLDDPFAVVLALFASRYPLC